MRDNKTFWVKSKIAILMTVLIYFFSVSNKSVDGSMAKVGYEGARNSQTMPRFILSASYEPGEVTINAESIEDHDDEFLSGLDGLFTFNWGIKYPNKEIQWIETDEPNLSVQVQGDDEKVIVFLEVIDDLGYKSALQHIEINPQCIYDAENQNLYIDAQGQLYRDDKRKYSHDYARLFLSYRENLPAKYKERVWMAITAKVLSPFSASSIIDAHNGGPLIKNVLPASDLEYIKNNSEDGDVYTFMVILLNFNGKAIQFVPVNFTYQANI